MTANAIYTISYSSHFAEVLAMLLAKHGSLRHPAGGFQLVGIVLSNSRQLIFKWSEVIFQTVSALGR